MLRWSGDDARDEALRVADNLENALSKAPGLDSLGSFVTAGGESLRLPGGDSGTGDPAGETDLWCVRGEPALVTGGNHFGFRDGVTGTVIRAWMTCVMGAARGAGNVGGKELNNRSKGGNILGNEVSKTRRVQIKGYELPIQPVAPAITHDLALACRTRVDDLHQVLSCRRHISERDYNTLG